MPRFNASADLLRSSSESVNRRHSSYSVLLARLRRVDLRSDDRCLVHLDESTRVPRVGVIEQALGESRGYDPHPARRRYYAIARLAGRHEMIVAARDKKT